MKIQNFKKILFLIPFVSFASSALASTGGGDLGNPTSPAPNCAINDPAGNTCATATPICDLNGYCGSTSASYTADYWSELNTAFCGSIENNSFLIFTASATSMTFNVWLTTSTDGSGIQIMVFSSAGACSGAVTSYVCWSPGTATAGPTAITAAGLTPGNNYYIMIDGYGGDVCDYIIGIQSGALIPVNATSSITGGQTICLGESATLTANGGDGNYTWGNNDGISATSGTSVSVTPTSEGTFTYNVTSGSGSTLCPATNAANVQVQVINCTCTITASNSGNICPGGSANLTATTVIDASGYSWTGPSGFGSTDQNILSITPPTTPGTYDYIVTATVPSGTCESTTTITVYEPPTVTLPADIAVCNQTPIAATLLTSTPVGATYAWTNSNPAIGLAISGTGDIPAFTASNSTNAVLQSTITVTPTLNGCEGVPSSFTISVLPTPIMNPVSNIIVCDGSTLNEVAFSSVFPSTTYSWTSNNISTGIGVSGNGNTPSFTATNTTNSATNSLITVTPALNACVGTSITFSIIVNPLPIVDAGLAQTVCAGTPVTMQGSGAITYSWDNGVTNNMAFNPTSTNTYTLTATDGNGCVNTDTVTVTVNPLPTVNAGTDQVFCIGTSTSLIASGSIGNNYTWSNGINDGVLFTPNTTQTYTVTAIDGNNCQNTDQIIVTVNPLPAINAGADESICVGTNVILIGSGGVSYTWTNGVNNGQSFAPGIGTNTYTVTGTDSNGCVNTDEITITALPVPVAAVTADTTTGYSPLNVTFTNNSVSANQMIWDFDDNNLFVTDNNPSVNYTFTNIGNYSVILIASNGICSDSAILNVIVLPFPDAIIHIPNVFTPNGDDVNDVFWIDVKFAATIEVQIFNRWGNLLLEMTNFTDRWDGKVNGNEVTDGVYFHKYTIVDLNGKTVQGHGNITIERK
jgi:gliding motility-associated-like protein